jgi:hypothetical protein
MNNIANCIRKKINNSSVKKHFKFDKNTYDGKKILEEIQIVSPKLYDLINNIQELDKNDMEKYGKKFKHIIYSDIKDSISGIKLIASGLKAIGFNNIYNNKLQINIPDNDNNFALLTSVTIYEKPFPVKLRNEIIKIFNKRPDNVNGEQIRFLLIDQGFKEGIDAFDVKYVHLFDELTTPNDEKQAIGRGTRFCGQKGLEFNQELGWPLHVFKYRLILNEKYNNKYNTIDAFSLYLKYNNIDIRKLYFSAELENICRYGAVDYEINKSIHEFGNEKEETLEEKEIIEKVNNFQNFKLKDIYLVENKNNDEFYLAKKAYKQFGGVKFNKLINKNKNQKNKIINKIQKNTSRFINIKKVKGIQKNISTKFDFITMRKYVRKYFKQYKWSNIIFENKCINDANIIPKRIVDLNNSQQFISNFFTADSVYKGILLWHSVGTGKTCSAISVASNSFEKENYTILWVTRHTLKPDIWKNMYKQICSYSIKQKIENGIDIPEDIKGNYLKYLDNKWLNPISYKQFSNLIAGKNILYKDLVKRNGKQDPLKKTLIIIDEAHKLFSDDTPVNERPNIKVLKSAIYNSYKLSKENSCKLLLMTATPYTNNPIQLFKLLNLLREDDYFTENFDDFKEEFLDDNYKFTPDTTKKFLDKITGYISYLNREKDIRQFAYPVIYFRDVNMSSKDDINKLDNSIYELFFDDIKDYSKISIIDAKIIMENLKEIIKKNKKDKDENLTQEEAFNNCIKLKKNNKDNDNDEENDEDIINNKIKQFIIDLNNHIKEIIKKEKEEAKEKIKKEKEEAKEKLKKEKEEAKEKLKKEKEEAKEKLKKEKEEAKQQLKLQKEQLKNKKL